MTVQVSEIFFQLSTSFRQWTATALADLNGALPLSTTSLAISRAGGTNEERMCDRKRLRVGQSADSQKFLAVAMTCGNRRPIFEG
jgi:hypothetical protein